MGKNVKRKSQHKTANPEFAAAMRELGRSSAANKHDSRPNRIRTRQSSKRHAISNGW